MGNLLKKAKTYTFLYSQPLENVPLDSNVATSLWKAISSLRKVRVAQAFVNVEDAIAAGVDVKGDDQDVERVRRAHRNDLENIPLFLITGLIFVATDPNAVFALMLFRLYAVVRVLHTIVYAVVVVRQPARTLCFFGGVIINFIMICSIFSTCMQL